VWHGEIEDDGTRTSGYAETSVSRHVRIECGFHGLRDFPEWCAQAKRSVDLVPHRRCSSELFPDRPLVSAVGAGAEGRVSEVCGAVHNSHRICDASLGAAGLFIPINICLILIMS